MERVETKHTPGPWLVEPINGGKTYQVTSDESRHFTVIAETPVDGTGCEEANANLISASPALYQAARLAELFILGFEGDELQEGVADLLTLLRSAISKADGKP